MAIKPYLLRLITFSICYTNLFLGINCEQSDLHTTSSNDTSSPLCFALRDKPVTDGSKMVTKWVDNINCSDLAKFKHTKRFDNKNEYSYTALIGDACLMEGWMCDDNAHCINNGTGSFECRCNDGYSGTGFACEEVISQTAVSTALGFDPLGIETTASLMMNAKAVSVLTSNLTSVTETTKMHSAITYVSQTKDQTSDQTSKSIFTSTPGVSQELTVNFSSSEILASTENSSTTSERNVITAHDTTTSGLISAAASTLISTQIVATTPTPTPTPCPITLTDCSEERTRSVHYGNSTYCLVEIGQSWDCAEEQCQFFNQSLAVVDDEGEAKYLSSEVHKDSMWTKWIGLYTVNENKIWLSEGRNATYLNWNGGHPWTVAEHPLCGQIRGGPEGLFHSAYCHTAFGFVCETTNTTAL